MRDPGNVGTGSFVSGDVAVMGAALGSRSHSFSLGIQHLVLSTNYPAGGVDLNQEIDFVKVTKKAFT